MLYVPINYLNGSIESYQAFIAPRKLELNCNTLKEVYIYFSLRGWKITHKDATYWKLVRTNEYLLHFCIFPNIWEKSNKVKEV
ncbi:MAG: hypothetical protein NZ845_01285 [Thermodesulfovibrio sp.]|nr:hypothetical protein [Thermodesulfovibrio sp.]